MTQTKAELLQTRHQGDLKLGDADSSHYVGFKAPATVSSSLVWTLPAADGTAGYLLKTDGSGNLGWQQDNSGVTLSGSTNNTIATVTGANALQGEAKLTFDGNHVVQTISASGEGARFIAAGNHYPEIRLNANRTSAGNSVGHILGQWNGTDIAAISFIAGADTTNKDDGEIKFNTRLSGAGITERMRIDSSGKVGIGKTPESAVGSILQTKGNDGISFQRADESLSTILRPLASGLGLRVNYQNGSEVLRIDSAGRLLIGTTTEGAALADNLTVSDSGDTGITIRSGTSSSGSLYFSDGTSGSAEKMGEINYYHANNGFQFKTAATLALTLNGDQNAIFAGTVRIGGSSTANTAGDDLVIEGSSDRGLSIISGSGSSANIYFGDSSDTDIGRIVYQQNDNAFQFAPNGATALTLNSSQNATFASAIYGPVKTVSALELNLSTGNYFIKTISGNSTFTFANPAASGTVTAFTLELTHSSGTVTWPSSVKWNADTAPTLTTGKTHLFMFVTDDGGTRYRGSALVDYVN